MTKLLERRQIFLILNKLFVFILDTSLNNTLKVGIFFNVSCFNVSVHVHKFDENAFSVFLQNSYFLIFTNLRRIVNETKSIKTV